MARYIGAVCRLCRREGTKLFLKGDRCRSHRCALEKKTTAPGQHGSKKQLRSSEYGLQLREKQKAKRIFSILEKQFRKYFRKAEGKEGITGENLLVLIERRLDNVVYKLGIASSRKLARQLIIHRHFLVNNRCVDKPSYLLKEGDVITVKERSKGLALFKSVIERKEEPTIPNWLEIASDKLGGKVVRIPKRDDITIPISEQLIVELYSK